MRVVITFFVRKKSQCVLKLHSECRNHTLRVEITLVRLVRVEVTVVSVVITFVRVKITVRVEIALFV
jgi:hypothetical protein